MIEPIDEEISNDDLDLSSYPEGLLLASWPLIIIIHYIPEGFC